MLFFPIAAFAAYKLGSYYSAGVHGFKEGRYHANSRYGNIFLFLYFLLTKPVYQQKLVPPYQQTQYSVISMIFDLPIDLNFMIA